MYDVKKILDKNFTGNLEVSSFQKFEVKICRYFHTTKTQKRRKRVQRGLKGTQKFETKIVGIVFLSSRGFYNNK
jgi:hypothetical protein